jgi:F1F0 ATPase subunit 2
MSEQVADAHGMRETTAMTLLWQAIGGLLSGAALAVLYFGGLWHTLQRLPAARNPALLTLASLAVRLALVGLGFYLVLRLASEPGLAAALVSFIAVRMVLTRRLGPRVPVQETRS